MNGTRIFLSQPLISVNEHINKNGEEFFLVLLFIGQSRSIQNPI